MKFCKTSLGWFCLSLFAYPSISSFAQEDTGVGDSSAFALDTTDTGTGGDSGVGDSNTFALDTTNTGTGGDSSVGDSNTFALDTTNTGTGGDSSVGDSNAFALDTTDTGTGGDSGVGDSNTFALDTTDTGTGGDSGVGDSNAFALDTTDTGTGGDSGVGDSNAFALDTTDTGTGGDSGVGDSNAFALDTTDTGTGGDSGVGDSNAFALNTTDTGTGGDSGVGDSNAFALDTTDTGTGGDSGVGDSNTFALNTTDTGSGGDSGVGYSNAFALDTTDTGTGGDSGVGDSNAFALDTTDGNTTEGYLENIQVSGGDFASPFYEFNDSHGSPLALDTKVFFRGSTYVFQDAGVSASHPFMIGQSWGDTNSSLVTGGPLNGSGGQVSLNIPMDFNGSLYYFCTNHTSMIAPLIIGDQGHPVFDLNASALLALTGQSLASGNFAVVDQNESNVDLEPVVQDDNGTWFPTQASDYVNLVPNRFALLDDLMQWFDDRDLQPIGFLDAFEHNASGIDSNQTQPNTAPQFQSDGNLSVTENQTFVYEFNASDPDANTTLSYSILSGDDAGKFTLNSTTGGLSFATAPDFESPEDSNADNIYQLSIQVSDGEANATLNVSVSVQDIETEDSDDDGFTDKQEILANTNPLSASEVPNSLIPSSLIDLSKLAIWLDANDLDGNFAPDTIPDLSFIDLWKDKSGNSKNATRNNYINRRPQYISQSTKGKAALKFDGSDDYMDLPDNSLTFGSIELFVVGKFIGSGQLIGASSNARLYISKSASSLFYQIGESPITGPELNSLTHVFRLSHQGTIVRGYLDGQLVGSTSDTKSGYPQMLNIGSNGNGGSKFFSGYVNEIIGFTNYLMSEEESLALDEYFRFKWINSAPTELNATSSLTFNENLPVGSVIAEFNATDPEGDSLAYSLVDGNGSTHNHLFTLETNGTLKTATSFDYETNASSYSIRVQAKDEHNASIEKEFTLTLNDLDDTAPVITLIGDSNITHEAGPEYVDAGARWNDSVDGNGTADANGTVNSQVPGIYLITYTYTDSSGNPAVPVTRTIEVVDTTPPVITLIGDENVTHLASTPYNDQGAQSNDIVDGNGSADANGTVDSDTPGIYQVTYSATDTAGNEAEPVVRTIQVVDSQAPVITLIGDSNITHEAGPEYVDAGARWNDSVDGNGTADANGTVNSQVPGIYLITYTYTDSSGNPAVPVTRTIQVEDTTPPVITLIGDANITHLASTTYIDQGAQWNDLVDGNGSADANGTVDSDTPGIYYITYSATDTAGNEAEQVVRTIQVVDNQDAGYGDSNVFALDTTDSGTGGDTGHGDSNGFSLDTTDSGTGGDTGVGDSNGFSLDTTNSGTGGDTGHGDSNGFSLDTTDSGNGGDTGVGDSNGFSLDTTDSGTGGDTGYGDSNGFTLDTTDSGTGGDTGVGDSNGFSLDTTDSGTGGDTGHGDSNGFSLDTTDSGTGGDTGYGDSNGFTLDTTDSGTGGDTGHGDSNGFSLDTTDSGTGEDTGSGDSNGFKLDTTDPVVQKPLVNTSNTMLEENGSIQLSGDVYFDGGGSVEDFGFVLSSTISLDKSKSNVIWVRAVGKPEEFTLKVTQSPFPNVMYYRAWARNSAGYGIGQVKKVRIPEAPKSWWGNALEETGGWKTSDWFGTFIYYEKGWLYHAQLGWLYSSDTNTEGVWLWKEKLGWLWTKEGIWPYLYKNDTSSWIYYTTNRNGKPLFYDYLTEQYLFFEDSSVDQAE